MTGDFLIALLAEIPKTADCFCVALDGRSAAGKTTLAAAACAALQKRGQTAAVVHMDDYYRPVAERKPEPAGHMALDRLEKEVLLPFTEHRTGILRRFDCRRQQLAEPIALPCKGILILEGAYALHPRLRRYVRLGAFYTLSPALQRRRILDRQGEAGAAAFFDRWIPAEEAYLSATAPEKKADLIFQIL